MIEGTLAETASQAVQQRLESLAHVCPLSRTD